LSFCAQPCTSAHRESSGTFLIVLLAVLASAGPTRTLAQSGAVDPSFTNGAPGLALTRLAVQPDGKILVGSGMNIAGQTTVSNVVRLNPDGDLDTTFTPGPGLSNITILPGVFTNVAPGAVLALTVQSDGRILVGGTFNMAGGLAKTNLVRLNTNGVLDAGFDAGLADGSVASILPLNNGTIFIGGAFTKVGGVARPGIARITSSGALDTSFVPSLGSFFGARVSAIAVQPGDGRIVIAGGASYFNPVPTVTVVPVLRLETSGTLDASFATVPLGSHLESAQNMVLQSDGKIVISGLFASVGGAPHAGIACLNSNGTLNANWPGSGVWATNSAYRNVSAMVAQPDGNILIGGRFEQYNGTTRIGVARLNPDGTLDSTFNSPATSTFQVGPMAMQSAKPILGGIFTLGTTTYSVIRLGGGNASPTLTFSLQAGNILHFDVPAGFKLQQAPTATGSWDDVPGSPPFDLPTTSGVAFFRLISI